MRQLDNDQNPVRHIGWMIGLALLLLGSFSYSEEAGQGGGHGSTADELIVRAMEQQRQGFLVKAWDAQMAFFGHPRAVDVDKAAIHLCLGLWVCPNLGLLGQIVGKGKEDTASLDVFCASGLEQRPDILDNLRYDCEEWARRMRWQLSDSNLVGRNAQNGVVPLRLKDFGSFTLEGVEHSQVQPLVEIQVAGGESVHTVVDTGSSQFSFADGIPLPEHLRRQEGFLDDFIVSIVRGPLNEHWQDRQYRLAQVAVSSVKYKHVVGGYRVGEQGSVPERPSLLGMSLLLRHGAVCLDWAGAKLHLGDLGPCASGIRIDDATLDGAMVIQLHVPVLVERKEKWSPVFRPYTDLSTMFVLLDTGSTLTYCSKRFVQLNGGDLEFLLAGHESLRARCAEVVENGFRDDGGLGYEELAILGMDSLLEYAAVGWSLAPLRVYFVPKVD